MMKQSAAVLLTVSLCLAACNRTEGGNKAKAAVTNNSAAAAPAAGNTSKAAAPAQAAEAQAALALDSEGLRAVETASGRTSLLAFGSPANDAVEGLSRIFGARPSQDGTNSDCGAGPTRIVQWANGFSMLAQDDKLAGWDTDKPVASTMNGIGVGSTRAELDEAFDPQIEEDTIGLGFTIGEGEDVMGGYLSGPGPEGRITSMFAGLTCHFG